MSRARFVAAARREFLAQVIYYNEEQPGLGARFTAAIEEAVIRALAFPLAGSPATRNTRRVFVKDFPFAVVYRAHAEGITVSRLLIIHAVPDTGSCGFRNDKASGNSHPMPI